MITKTTFGQLEQAVMDVLWRRQSATVREVIEALKPKRRTAYTTVMTVMNRLVEQGCLKRQPRTNGAFEYSPTQSREAHVAAAAKHSFDRLVHQYGDVAVVQFLDQLDQIPTQKLQQLRQQLRKRKK